MGKRKSSARAGADGVMECWSDGVMGSGGTHDSMTPSLHHSVRVVPRFLLVAGAFLAFAASASPARAELEVRVSTASAGQYQPVEVTAWDPDGSTASRSDAPVVTLTV